MTEEISTMPVILREIFLFSVMLIWLKVMIVGSEFNIWYWLNHGKTYIDWYNKRPDFKKYLQELNKKINT